MARTIPTIQDEIILEKSKYPELEKADSTSFTALWRKITHLIATIINYHEQNWDGFKSEVQTIADNNIVGTPQWFVREAYKFQDGDPLEIIAGNRLGYSAVDPEKQIIKRAAFVDQVGLLLLKVATTATPGGAASPSGILKLTADQKTRFTAYMKKIRPAGVNFTVVSDDADLLRPYLDVYYDSILNADTVKNNVILAIKDYLASIDFGGVVYISALTDAVQAVTGVMDVYVRAMDVYNKGSVLSFDRTYLTSSGYIQLEDTAAFDPDVELHMIVF